MASDMRATYGTEPHGRNYEAVGPNDQCGKMFQIAPFPTMACVAGKMSQCHAVVAQLVFNIRKLAKIGQANREFAVAAIDDARVQEIHRLYNWTMHTSWGISLRDFATGKVPGGKLDKLLIRAGYHLLRKTPFEVQIIAGGFMGRDTMFFRGANKLRLEQESSPGVYAIGAGHRHAMRVLNKRGQNYAMSLPRTLLHVHEALIAARKERTVGPATAYIVLRKHTAQVVYLPANSPTLEQWRKAYSGWRSTAALDDSHVAAIEIRQQLLVHKNIRPKRK
jgi:hypothetical protein